MAQARPYILAETNWKTVRDTDYQVAVLPWGATEAHNYHLPYATDTLQCDRVAAESARLAWDRGARPIILPTVPYGVNAGQMDIKLCLNLNPSTQFAILCDFVEVMQEAGINKLVIFNGHGGNHFKQMIRELYVRYPEVFVCVLNWYQAADWNQYFTEPGDHAGEMETSCMMHICPDWVLPLSEAGDGAAKEYRFKAFKAGWATALRHWSQVTEDTGVGDPAGSTAEKGRVWIDAVSKEIADFFVELAEADLNDLYE